MSGGGGCYNNPHGNKIIRVESEYDKQQQRNRNNKEIGDFILLFIGLWAIVMLLCGLLILP